jgi:hypothetical protein
MRTKLKLPALVLLAHTILNLHLSTAFAQGTAFTYQGRLNDGGSPANGSYDLVFTLYAVNSGGTAVTVPVTNSPVPVSNGLFAATIDFGSGVFTGNGLWLEVAARTNGAVSFSTLSPRQKLLPTPYAIYGETAGVANTVLNGSVSSSQLNTPAPPTSGQVLEFNGSALAWTTPATGLSAWGLSGNAGTTAGANFVGTTDNQPLEFHVNGTRALRLEPTGGAYPNVIGGGPSNFASNGVAGVFVGGGINNIGGGNQSFVGGGYQNYALGYISSIAGGAYNQSTNSESFVGAGVYNVAGGASSAVCGGYGNHALSDYSCVLGGDVNSATGLFDTVGGGNANVSSGNNSTSYFVTGGPGSVGIQGCSAIGGGFANTASGTCATIPGGVYNIASGDFSYAAGCGAVAANNGSFVWADDSSFYPYFSSTANNQFLIRASGGVGIGTAQTPPGGLRVASGGLAVTGASSPNYPGAAGVFIEKYSTTAGLVYAYDYTNGAPLSLALNSPGGNVGIGTLSPQYTLDINGTTRTHSIIITGGADLAEPFQTGSTELPKGSVVVIDKEHPGELKLSSRAYDKTVAGIVSGANGINPGIALHQEGALDGGQNVALSGRVYVQADASNGPIEPGDLLTTSDKPGEAMKVRDHTRAQGAIIGKAMSSLAAGNGMVLVLVSLQ